jgi:hypothetical protein
MEAVVKYIITILVGVVCIVTAIGTNAAAAQSAGSAVPIWVDYTAPPARIEQLTSVADAVALVRIEAIRFESTVDQKSGRERDVTKYDVRVVDTLEPHSMLATNQGTLAITRLGGQHSENGKVVRSAVVGFEDFQQNGEYILFLTWNQRTNEFDIAYGPEGSYQLAPSGTVRPLGRSAMTTTQRGKDRTAFLQELRIGPAR